MMKPSKKISMLFAVATTLATTGCSPSQMISSQGTIFKPREAAAVDGAIIGSGTFALLDAFGIKSAAILAAAAGVAAGAHGAAAAASDGYCDNRDQTRRTQKTDMLKDRITSDQRIQTTKADCRSRSRSQEPARAPSPLPLEGSATAAYKPKNPYYLGPKETRCMMGFRWSQDSNGYPICMPNF